METTFTAGAQTRPLTAYAGGIQEAGNKGQMDFQIVI
jgi:hypothetical protein